MVVEVPATVQNSRPLHGWTLCCSRHNLLPLTVFVVLLVLILAYWLPYRAEVLRQQQQLFHQHATALAQDLRQRLLEVEQLVNSGAAFVSASTEVQQQDWQQFTEALALEKHHPGIQAFGIVRLLSAAEVTAFQRWMQAQGLREFAIYPAGQRPSYAVVSHIQPFTALNQPVLGYDLLSDPMRRQTSLRAASLAQPALTPAVALVQDHSGNAEAGLILMQPVYRSGVPLKSAEQKLAALQHLVYVAFRGRDLLGSLDRSAAQHQLEFRWSDQQQRQGRGILFQSAAFAQPGLLQQQLELDLYGQPFLLELKAPPAYFKQQLPQPDVWALLAALALALLLFISLSLVNLRRYQAVLLQRQLTQQLQLQHQQLLANEQRQALVLKTSQLAWFEFDLTSGDAFYSDTCWRLLGYQRPMAIAQQQLLIDAMPAEDGRLFQQDLQLLLAAALDEFCQHYQFSNRQGQLLLGLFRLYLRRDNAGDAVTLYGTISDESGVRQQQTSLRQIAALGRFNLLLAHRLLAPVPVDATVVCRQTQWQHLQQLILYFSQWQQSALQSSAWPLAGDGWPGLDLSQQLQSLWPLLLAQWQLRDDPLRLAASLGDWQLNVCPLALRQCLSLMLSAALDWRAAGSPLWLQRQVLPQATWLELQFDIDAKWSAKLAQWPQHADEWRPLLQGVLQPEAAAEDLCWQLWSCMFLADRMDASFSLTCSTTQLTGKAPSGKEPNGSDQESSGDNERLQATMQLRFQS
jgi:CHASE1-domain containing sensor protein